MLKVFGFLPKREGIETQAFIDYYEHDPAPLICSLAITPIVYKLNYLLRGDELNQETTRSTRRRDRTLVFPDRAAYLAWGAPAFQTGLRRAGCRGRKEVSRSIAYQGLCHGGMRNIRLVLRQDSERFCQPIGALQTN
jgi:hypothetical protein